MSIHVHPDPLPDERRNDPRRRAEMTVLDRLVMSHLSGKACYEWKAEGKSQEVDFAVWVEDLGRFAIQVKGGQYALVNHDWHLVMPGAPMEKKPSPLVQTWDGAMSMHEVLEDVLNLYIYVIPVLILPDMDPDPHMAVLAEQKKVHLVWRGQDLSARLEEIAASAGVRRPPIRAHVENEFHAIMYREPLGSGAPARREAPAQMDLGATGLVINNYGPLIIITATPENLAGVMASLSSAFPPAGWVPQPSAADATPPEFPPATGDAGESSSEPW